MPRRRRKTGIPPSLRRAALLLVLLAVFGGLIWVAVRGGRPGGEGRGGPGPDFGDRIGELSARWGVPAGRIRPDDPIRKVDGVFVRTWRISVPDRETARALVEDLTAETAAWEGRIAEERTRGDEAAALRITLDREAFDVRLRIARGSGAARAAAPSRPSPTPAPTRRPTLPPGARGRLAILLDDAGQSFELVPRAAALPAAVGVAVLPFLPHSSDTAAEMHRTGHEVWLHLPMEPLNGSANPGAGVILVSMPEDEVRRTVRSALNSVPFIVGVNNHMGSRATADLRTMTWVMQEIAARGLRFIDSRTTVATVAEEAARAQGIPTGRRKVFLDNSSDPAAIRKQLDEAVYRARRDGGAIAIGHLHPPTLAVLERELPRLGGRGVTLVPPSKLTR